MRFLDPVVFTQRIPTGNKTMENAQKATKSSFWSCNAYNLIPKDGFVEKMFLEDSMNASHTVMKAG